MLKAYYRLTKPGIIYGNLLTAIGGFLLASRGHFNLRVFLAMAVGTSLVIASACVFNNVIDRDIDSRMTRTRRRAIVSGEISVESALIYGMLLGITGVNILWRLTNHTTLILGLVGFFTYVGLYTFSKRHTIHSTLIGSIPGATPIAAGYAAVTNHFDGGAQLLFLVMVLWQMPHFYAIGIFRKEEYAAAELPILPVVKGVEHTKVQITAYIAAYTVAAAALALLGYASFSFFVVMTGLGLYWLWLGIKGIRDTDNADVPWARRMFGWSLLILLSMCIMLSLDAWLP